MTTAVVDSPENEQVPAWWFLDTLVVEHRCAPEMNTIVLEMTLPVGSAPPLHVHDNLDDTWYILQGQMVVRCGEEELVVGAGNWVSMPRTVEVDGHEIDYRGFGRAYLEWILANKEKSWMSPPNLTSRPEQDRAVIEWGYMLLRSFLREWNGEEHLPDFDDSLVKRYQQEASSAEPYLETVQYASDNGCTDSDGHLIAWETDGVRWVSSNRALHAWAIKAGFKLPGGPNALTSHVMQKYKAQQDRRRRFCWPITNETPTLPTEE